MERIAEKKVHFAPLGRQEREIKKLLKRGRYRNVTHFMRLAIDYYLDRLDRPGLSQQARQMAEDFLAQPGLPEGGVSVLQDESRLSGEDWP